MENFICVQCGTQFGETAFRHLAVRFAKMSGNSLGTAARNGLRLIIVYSSILGAVNLIHHAVMWRAIINASVFGAGSVWYFYFKPNVAAYFRELRDRQNL